MTERRVGVPSVLLQAADAERNVCPRAAGEEPDKTAHAGAPGDENDIPGTDRRSEHVLRIGRGGAVRFSTFWSSQAVNVASSRFGPIRRGW
jgi:hypothetical protein